MFESEFGQFVFGFVNPILKGKERSLDKIVEEEIPGDALTEQECEERRRCFPDNLPEYFVKEVESLDGCYAVRDLVFSSDDLPFYIERRVEYLDIEHGRLSSMRAIQSSWTDGVAFDQDFIHSIREDNSPFDIYISERQYYDPFD